MLFIEKLINKMKYFSIVALLSLASFNFSSNNSNEEDLELHSKFLAQNTFELFNNSDKLSIFGTKEIEEALNFYLNSLKMIQENKTLYKAFQKNLENLIIKHKKDN